MLIFLSWSLVSQKFSLSVFNGLNFSFNNNNILRQTQIFTCIRVVDIRKCGIIYYVYDNNNQLFSIIMRQHFNIKLVVKHISMHFCLHKVRWWLYLIYGLTQNFHFAGDGNILLVYIKKYIISIFHIIVGT